MVTHPSTNRAWRRVTSLIETNALPLSHATNNSIRSLQFTHHRIRLCYSQRYKSHDIYLLVSQVDLTGTTLPDEAKQAENQMFGISTIQYKIAVRLTSLLFLKKGRYADLYSADSRACWPISNLSVLSKLLEGLVAQQLLDYLNSNRLLPELQSAYRAFHSNGDSGSHSQGDG